MAIFKFVNKFIFLKFGQKIIKRFSSLKKN